MAGVKSRTCPKCAHPLTLRMVYEQLRRACSRWPACRHQENPSKEDIAVWWELQALPRSKRPVTSSSKTPPNPKPFIRHHADQYDRVGSLISTMSSIVDYFDGSEEQEKVYYAIREQLAEAMRGHQLVKEQMLTVGRFEVLKAQKEQAIKQQAEAKWREAHPAASSEMTHCWRCSSTIDSWLKRCDRCSWHVCAQCHACGCEYPLRARRWRR